MRPDGRAGPAPYALLGRPVDHSLSPRIHRRAFDALGRDACYTALEAEASEVGPLMRALARSGGGGNVTLPHKARAAEALDAPTEAVRATGACNCFWGEADGRLAGDNTDVAGFRAAVERLLEGPDPLDGRTVLLLGAGGAASAVAHACLAGGADAIDVLNRTSERARALADRFGDPRLRPLAGRAEAAERYDLVVNATSLGLEPADPLPLELDELRVAAVFDLVYGPGGTDWTAHASERGVPAVDGGEMLVEQAAASLRRWVGEAPPVAVLRGALAGDG